MSSATMAAPRNTAFASVSLDTCASDVPWVTRLWRMISWRSSPAAAGRSRPTACSICPVGAFYGVLGQISPLRVVARRRAQCNDCMDCYDVCPEPQVITPALKGEKKGIGPVITAGACTNCGRCIDVCSKNVFTFGTRFGNTPEAAT